MVCKSLQYFHVAHEKSKVVTQLPRDLQDRFQTLYPKKGRVSIQSLKEPTQWKEDISRWCAHALSTQHVTTVAAVLTSELGMDRDCLAYLGVPEDLLDFFPFWEQGSNNGFVRPQTETTLIPVGAGLPLGAFRVQMSPAYGSVPIGLHLLRELLRSLEPHIQIYAVVRVGTNIEQMNDLVSVFGVKHSARVKFVQYPSASIFAQDNALGALDSQGHPVLLIPRTFGKGSSRSADELLKSSAEEAFGQAVLQYHLIWEGGNILNDEDLCLVGVDTVAMTVQCLGLTKEEVIEIFKADFGKPIVLLGDFDQAKCHSESGQLLTSGQASFHIDLDVSLLGRFGSRSNSRSLITDPKMGLEYLPYVLKKGHLFSNSFLSPRQLRDVIEDEYRNYTQERIDKLTTFRRILKELNYLLISVPELRINPRKNYYRRVNFDFSYCNVLPGMVGGRPAVSFLPWGIAPMDKRFSEVLEQQGVRAAPVSRSSVLANELMALHGGLRCFCGSIASERKP